MYVSAPIKKILLIFILFILVGTVYILTNRKSSLVDEPVKNENGNTNNQPPKEEWKLYEHPTGEYFFKYPADWEAVKVNEQDENYVITTRVSSAVQQSVIVEIGWFTEKEEFNDGNILWHIRNAQQFYDSKDLISVAEIENKEARYVELVFSESNHTAALIGIPQAPKDLFINIKAGWGTSKQEMVKKLLSSFSFSRDLALKSASVYCIETETIAKLTIAPDVYNNKTTKVVVKTIDKTTQTPLAGVSVWTAMTKVYLESGTTDSEGLFVMELPQVPDKVLTTHPDTGKPIYTSFTIDAFLGNKRYSLNTFNLASNTLMTIEIYFGDQEKENVIIFDNPIDVSTFVYNKCANIL